MEKLRYNVIIHIKKDFMEQTALSTDDLERINGCDFYLKAKEIMASCEHYANVQIGEVYLVKYKNYDKESVYVSRAHGEKPSKYMVVSKDNGFVFAKRINASGKLGVDIVCLTTSFHQPSYEIEPDPALIESIILDKEENYNPMSDAKDLEKKKNKARRENKKLELKLSIVNAKSFIDNLKIGDYIYDAQTSYGSGIIAWKVTDIEKRKTDKTPQSWGWGNNKTTKLGNTDSDIKHNECGFDEFTQISLTADDVPKARRWTNNTRNEIFSAFAEGGYHTYYKSPPATLDSANE